MFSLGLLTIIIKEYNLYTGKVGNWIPKDTLKLLVMFLLNAFGTALVAYLFTFTRANIDAIYPLVEAKVNDNLLSIFILACGCGAMMHIACFNFAVKNHPLYVIMPIMFFILCGFEHCVANAGFFAMAKTPLTLDLIIYGKDAVDFRPYYKNSCYGCGKCNRIFNFCSPDTCSNHKVIHLYFRHKFDYRKSMPDFRLKRISLVIFSKKTGAIMSKDSPFINFGKDNREGLFAFLQLS